MATGLRLLEKKISKFGAITFTPSSIIMNVSEQNSFFETKITLLTEYFEEISHPKHYILEIILEIFPKTLYTGGAIYMWDYKLDINDILTKLENKLLENPIIKNFIFDLVEFDFSSKLHLLNDPTFIWIFKMTNKKAKFTLEQNMCNFVAKIFMEKFMENGKINKKDIFQPFFYGELFCLNKIIKRLSFFNMYIFIKPEKRYLFNTLYLRYIEKLTLDLNHNVLRKLRSYCLQPNDLQYNREYIVLSH